MARPLQYILASFPNNGLPAEQTKGGRPEEREEWNHERFLLQNVDKDTLWHWNQWKVAEFCKEQKGTKVFLMADKILQENKVLDPILKML